MAKTPGRLAGPGTETETVERYRALLRALPDLVFIQRQDGTYTDFWAGTIGDLAVPREKVIGINIRDIGFSPDELTEALRAITRALETGKPQTYEYSLATLRGRGHFEARVVRLNRHEVLTAVRNITSRVAAEGKLIEASRQLEEDKQALLEKNIALEQILTHLESRAQEYQARIARELAREIRPVFKGLHKRVDPECREVLAQLEERLAAILRRDAEGFSDPYLRLSRRELEVCDLMRTGLTSKEISERLHVAPATVHKHREQIREKLGFRGQRINLAAYLRLHPASD
jgi:DNA-binding NarL/FixJ family response regulator